MLNIYLDQMGVYQSEMGFPALNHEANYINANLELAREGGIKRLRLEGWCRAIPEDIESTFKNCPTIRHLNVSLPTSDIMIGAKFQGSKTWKDILKLLVAAVSLAKEKGVETLGISAEDASRTELDKLIEFVTAGKEAGAVRFRYSDTLGADEPLAIYEKIKAITRATELPVELHCHNDIGMAVAVSLAGAQGATEEGYDAYINTTINGYGERAGNCDLVSVLLALKCSADLKRRVFCDESIDLSQSWKIAQYASQAFNIPIPLNQPGVGANAFAHEAGIHADGTLKDRRSYELYDPEAVGRGTPELFETGRIITTGAYGGIKGFRHVYSKLGIDFRTDSEARKILNLVQYANLHTQKPLMDDELKLIAHYPDIVATILTVTP
jgi:homocitrate synthase NifV